MKQEEMSKAIHEGINRSINDVFYAIIIATITLIVIFIIFSVVGKIQDNKFEKDFCGEEGCPEPQIAFTESCDKPYVYCYIIDKEIEEKQQMSEGGGIIPIIKESKFCGYSEALSWYQLYKESIKTETYMECN